ENKGLTATRFFSQLLCLQYLRDPLASVLSKGLITPLESALTENAPVTPLESVLTKKGGGRGHGLTAPPAPPSIASPASPAHSAALLRSPAPHHGTCAHQISRPAFSPLPSAAR